MSLQLSAYKHGEVIYHKDGRIETMPVVDGLYILLLGADGNYAIRQMSDNFDVFLSADMKYPESIYLSGQAETKPKIFDWSASVFSYTSINCDWDTNCCSAQD